jgi:hypothetical protein
MRTILRHRRARSSKQLEVNLERGLHTPGEIVSLSGPSKSGKTVLIQNVVGEESLIVVQGSNIGAAEDIWDEVLDEVGIPNTTEESSGSSAEIGATLRARIKTFLPGMSASAESEIQTRVSENTGETQQYDRSGLRQVVDDIADNHIILIDDFHYLSRNTQEDVAQMVKEAARQEISMCVALVPHRSDDLLRANSDLRGRVRNIDIGYWNRSDLVEIAYKGFEQLGVNVSDELVRALGDEAAGSPQLMQRLCLQICYEKDISQTQNEEKDTRVDSDELKNAYNKTVDFANHGSTFDILDEGPKTRGKERTIYKFAQGEGDVYRCLLRAIASDPPQRSFKYEELKQRTREQCKEGHPSGSSIIGSCEKMDELIKDSFPNERALDWDEAKQHLYIPDPYLLFYLRWSGRLELPQSVALPTN